MNKRIKFSFGKIHITQSIVNDWQIFVHVESDFSIFVGNKILYQEYDFNIAEFAVSVSQWFESNKTAPIDYYYETVDSEDVGFVWFKKNGSRWQIGSINQEYEETRLFELSELDATIKGFLTELINHLPKDLGSRVKRLSKSI